MLSCLYKAIYTLLTRINMYSYFEFIKKEVYKSIKVHGYNDLAIEVVTLGFQLCKTQLKQLAIFV